MRITTDKMKRIELATMNLMGFVNGWLKPTEAKLDEWQDELVDLLEMANDQRYPDALATEEEPPLMPEE